MRILFSSFALLSVCTMPGCVGNDEGIDTAYGSEVLYFEQIGYGQRGSLKDSTEIALRSPQEWAIYRDSLKPIAPFDSVDFEQGIVMLVALPQESSGHSINFVNIEAHDSVTVAEYVVSAPAEDCLAAFAETVPFTAVMVRRTDNPVRFEREIEEYRCTFGRRR